MIKVQLLLFAVLRDIVGADRQSLAVVEGTRPADLWRQLRQRYPKLERYENPPMTAINQSYASPDTVLSDGDEIAFIPPVSGG